MNKKVTPIVLATVLGSQIALTAPSHAEGRRGPNVLSAPPVVVTRTELETETRDRTIGAGMEAEYEKRTRGSDGQEKFTAEFEIIKPNSLGIDENTTGLGIVINGAPACTFKTPGVVATEFRKGQAVQVVEFRATIQRSTIAGVETVKEVGDCQHIVPAVQDGFEAEVVLTDGSTGTPTTSELLNGTFKPED